MKSQRPRKSQDARKRIDMHRHNHCTLSEYNRISVETRETTIKRESQLFLNSFHHLPPFSFTKDVALTGEAGEATKVPRKPLSKQRFLSIWKIFALP